METRHRKFHPSLKRMTFASSCNKHQVSFSANLWHILNAFFAAIRCVKKVLHILAQTRDVSYKVDRVLSRICITLPFGHLKFVLTT